MARGGLLMAQVLFINGAVRISVLMGGGSTSGDIKHQVEEGRASRIWELSKMGFL